jgi:hypothetical protein
MQSTYSSSLALWAVDIALISTQRSISLMPTLRLPKTKSTLCWRIVASYNTVHAQTQYKEIFHWLCSNVLKFFKNRFHFRRTVAKRIKKIFKFQNLVNVDRFIRSYSYSTPKSWLATNLLFWCANTPEIRGFITSFQSAHAHRYVRYGTIAIWYF